MMNHLKELISLSDQFEQELFDEIRSSTKSPKDAINKLNKMKFQLPDKMAGSRDDIIVHALSRKEIDDVISMIRDEALNRKWEE